MKNKSKNKIITIENILIIFLLFQPILDAVTTLCIEFISPSMTIGIVVRSLFLVTMAIGTLFIISKADRKNLFSYYILVGIYSLIYMYSTYTLLEGNMIFTQIKGLVKTLYLPIVLVDLYYIYKTKKIRMPKEVLLTTVVGYASIILLTKMLGVAYPTYKHGQNIGTVGLFFSGNEIGAIICMLSPFLILKMMKNNLKMEYIYCVVLVAYAILEMGTKVPFLGFMFLIISAVIIQLLKKVFKDKSYNFNCVKHSIAAFIICYMVAAYFPVGMNMNRVYGKIFWKPNDTTSISISENITDFETFQTKSVSGRNRYYKNTKERYEETPTINKAFGMGYSNMDNNGNYVESKLVEIDYYDIFFCHGIIGCIIIMLPLVVMLIKIIKLIAKKFKAVIIDEEILLNGFSVGIALGIALLAGHVFVSPAVSIILAISVNELIVRLQQKVIKK